ncbi:hypothetical protein [Streptomyces yangpuensis]|uniref:hypothetical protein n=1 Tax=Streptomyces yangpuensis TaxID=1648182 RepID=UPI00382DE18D
MAPGSLLHGVVERLLALIAAGEPADGGPGGDLPARRRLHSLLAPWIRDRRMCAALARRLATEPELIATRTALLVRAIDLAGPEPDILLALREPAAAIGDRPVLAGRVAEDLRDARRYGEPLAAPAPPSPRSVPWATAAVSSRASWPSARPRLSASVTTGRTPSAPPSSHCAATPNLRPGRRRTPRSSAGTEPNRRRPRRTRPPAGAGAAAGQCTGADSSGQSTPPPGMESGHRPA